MAKKVMDVSENARYFEAYMKILNDPDSTGDLDTIETRRVNMLMRIGGLLETAKALEDSLIEVDWELLSTLEYFKLLYKYHQYEDVTPSKVVKVNRIVKLMFFTETAELENRGIDFAILDGCYVATPIYQLPPDAVLRMLKEHKGRIECPEEYGLPSMAEANYGTLQWDGNDEYDRLIGRKYGPLSDYFLHSGTTEFPVVLAYDTFVGESASSSKSYKYASSTFYK